jgi:hypothetical protein
MEWMTYYIETMADDSYSKSINIKEMASVQNEMRFDGRSEECDGKIIWKLGKKWLNRPNRK